MKKIVYNKSVNYKTVICVINRLEIYDKKITFHLILGKGKMYLLVYKLFVRVLAIIFPKAS